MSSEWLIHTVEQIAAPVPSALATGPFGSSISAKYFAESGVPVIRGSNLSPETSIRLIEDGLVFVSEAKAEEFTRSIARRGDLIFTCWGTINQVGFIDERASFDRYIVSNKQMKLTVDSSRVDPRFIYYVFSSPKKQAEILDNGIGSSVPGFNLGQLKKHEILLPCLAEQVAIANLLESLDSRIALLRETNATLEAMAQALFKSWFVDFDPVHTNAGTRAATLPAELQVLFPSTFTDTPQGPVPEGWRVMPFLDACDLQGGAQPPAKEFVDSELEGYVRLLQIRDFSTDTHITYVPDTKKLKKATEDDVLIGRYGSASGDREKDSLGRVCRGLAGAYNVALMKLLPIEVGREFSYQLVRDPRFYNYLQGVSSKAVQSGFSKSELSQYRVVVPTRNAADFFEDFGLSIWQQLKVNNQQAQTLATLRDTLMPRLISGQLRLPDAEAALAEAGV